MWKREKPSYLAGLLQPDGLENKTKNQDRDAESAVSREIQEKAEEQKRIWQAVGSNLTVRPAKPSIRRGNSAGTTVKILRRIHVVVGINPTPHKHQRNWAKKTGPTDTSSTTAFKKGPGGTFQQVFCLLAENLLILTSWLFSISSV